MPGRGGPKMNKDPVTPRVKMKQLHWDRIVLAPKEGRAANVWDDVKEPELPLDDLEKLFCTKPPPAPKAKSETAKPKVQVVMILDPKRSNAIGIMMAKLPAVSEIKEAIMEADEDTLSYEQLIAVSNNYPTMEEIGQVKSAHEAGQNLDKPEKFVLVMASIPKCTMRISVWLFKLTFFERTQELKPPLETCKRASKEIIESKSLKMVLGSLIALGNYMNGGTRRGQADGFKIEFLPKFKDTKDISNKRTLLEFAIEMSVDRAPEAMQLPEEMRFVKFASKVALEDLGRDVNKLDADLKNAHKQLKAIQQDMGGKDEDDEFSETIQVRHTTDSGQCRAV